MNIAGRKTRSLLTSRLFGARPEQPGSPPGTLTQRGEGKVERPKLTIITYDEAAFEEREIALDQAAQYASVGRTLWLNVDGLGDVEVLRELGRIFEIHELILEDIVNTGQRPKVEEHDDCFFVVLKMIYGNRQRDDIEAEQVSLIVKKGVIISFQEREGDVFGMIRDRLRSAKGRVRKTGADYLAFALMDAIVDNYFVVMEQLGDQIEILESEVLEEPGTQTAGKLHALRTRTILLRRSIWPLREVVSGLMRAESKLVHKTTLAYMRDLYDHTIQVVETLETYRDMLSGMLDLYLSSVSNRMNEVMKVLTMIATLFIPLSFIAGVYGMNFQNMPELTWRWGYAGALALMAAVAATFLVFFKKKRWF